MSTPTSSRLDLVGASPPPIRRDRRVMVWVGATGVSGLGDAAYLTGLAWTAVQELEPLWAGIVVSAGGLVQAGAGLVGGVLADRRDPRRILLAVNLIRVATLLTALGLWPTVEHRILLLAVTLAFGLCAGVATPAGWPMVRQLVATADLTTLAGWTQAAGRIARMAGAPLGALLVAAGGFPLVVTANAISFLVVLAALRFVVVPRYALPRAPTTAAWRAWSDTAEYLRDDRRARWLLVGLSGTNLFLIPLFAIALAQRATASGWGAWAVGAAESVFAIVALIGTFASARLRPARRARTAFLLLTAEGLAIALAMVDSLWAVMIAMVVIGATAGLCSVWLSGLYAETVAPHHLGRVGGLTGIVDLALGPLAVPAWTILATGWGLGAAGIVFGAAMTLMCVGLAFHPVLREIR